MKASSIHLGSNVAHLRFSVYKSKSESTLNPEKIITSLKTSSWYGMDFVYNPLLNTSENAFRFINKALDIARQSYVDEPGGEQGNCTEFIDDIKDSLLFFDESSLDFLIKWPYFRDELSNLGYAVDNGVPLYPILENIEKVMCDAMTAKRTGVYIPGTGTFVNLNKINQITQKQLNNLIDASNMLEDLGFRLSATSYLNLESFEDNSYARAWRTLGATDINLPLENDLISDERVSLAQYLGHEDSHHIWDELVSEGVMLDPELDFEKETFFAIDTDPNEVLGEVLANSLDMSFALSLRGRRDLNRYRLEESCHELSRVISTFKQGKYLRNMTDQGILMLEQAEERNRETMLSVRRKPR